MEAKLDTIEQGDAAGQGIGTPVLTAEERLRILEAKFPAVEEESLKVLADAAKQEGLELVSLTPHPKEIFLDKNGQPVVVEGKACYQVFVTLDAKGSFRNVVRYLEQLKASPLFATVERLSVVKEKPEDTVLVVGLDMRVYLLRS